MNEASSAVRWLLQQAEPEARRVAVQQIAKVRGREGPELLLRALGDDDWRVRKEGASIAPALEMREEVVASLIAALEETLNIGLRNAAVEALVAIGSDAVGATVDALSRVDADSRKLAVEVLGGVPDARGMAALMRSLADEDANVRVASAEALGNAALAGEESRDFATQALVASLATTDTFLKIAALDSLARLEARLPWSLFEPLSRDPLLRRYAIAAAAGSREPDAVRSLAQATGDASPTIAREGIVALGDLVSAVPEAEDLFAVAREALFRSAIGQRNVRRTALDAEDTRARGGALLLLGLLHDVGDVPSLVEALADDDVAERAELALRIFGSTAVGPLLASANFSLPPVRVAAFGIASTLEGADVKVVREALRRGLGDASFEVVAGALDGLGRVGDAADLARIAAFVEHKDERIAAIATNAVSETAARHPNAARTLLQENPSGNDPLALGCILLGALARMQHLHDDDVRLLERALAHGAPQVRRAAIDALAQSGGEAAADAVAFALADEEDEVKLAAVRALGRLGRADPLADVIAHTRDPGVTATALRALGEADPERALSAARPLVMHADAAIACAATEAIGQLTGPRVPAHLQADALDGIFEALDHPDAEVVKLALSLVGERPGPRTMARLGICLDHASWEVRRIAAELLGQDKSPAAQALLRSRYEREKDPIVRHAIAAAVSVRPPAETLRPSPRGD